MKENRLEGMKKTNFANVSVCGGADDINFAVWYIIALVKPYREPGILVG